jgi:hypothetical protein
MTLSRQGVCHELYLAGGHEFTMVLMSHEAS